MQHSLPGGLLRPYPNRSSSGWITPASPGAQKVGLGPAPIDRGDGTAFERGARSKQGSKQRRRRGTTGLETVSKRRAMMRRDIEPPEPTNGTGRAARL